jgi:hypothetical protein
MKRSQVEGSRGRTERNAGGLLDFPRNDDGLSGGLTSMLALELSADVVSLELGIYEIFLAGKTGAVFLFVV